MTQQRRDKFRNDFRAFAQLRQQMEDQILSNLAPPPEVPLPPLDKLAQSMESLLGGSLRTKDLPGARRRWHREQAIEQTVEKTVALVKMAELSRLIMDYMEGDSVSALVLNDALNAVEVAAEYAYRRHGLVPADLL